LKPTVRNSTGVSSASDDDGAGELEEHGYPQPYPYHEAMPVRLAEQPPECTGTRFVDALQRRSKVLYLI
jgi:hypothetical protein